MMKIGYARVSTTHQSLDNQINQLEAAGCEKIFSEKRSGKKGSEREQFELMKEFIREGDVVFVTKLDRLARSVVDLHKTANYMEMKSVDLKVLHQQIDTTFPAGKLMFSILGAIAEFERDLIHDRVQEGIEAAKKKGTKFGRKEILTSEDKKDVLELYNKGKSVLSISRIYHVTRNTIYRAIKVMSQKQ
jgi:DNA invertase Pin-like site-specific DNA recombinase